MNLGNVHKEGFIVLPNTLEKKMDYYNISSNGLFSILIPLNLLVHAYVNFCYQVGIKKR